MPKKRRSRNLTRPPSVSVAALAVLVSILIFILREVLDLMRSGVGVDLFRSAWLVEGRLTAGGQAGFVGVLQVLLAAFALVLLFSMLRMRRWAWVALMSWSIGSMLVNLILYFYGRPNYLNMFLMVVIVFSLAQGEVLAALGIRRRIHESVH